MDPRTERKRVDSLMDESRWEEAAVVLNGIVAQQKRWERSTAQELPPGKYEVDVDGIGGLWNARYLHPGAFGRPEPPRS